MYGFLPATRSLRSIHSNQLSFESIVGASAEWCDACSKYVEVHEEVCEERGLVLVPVMVLTTASNMDNWFFKWFCSWSLLFSVFLRAVASLLPSTWVPLMMWLIVWLSCIFSSWPDQWFTFCWWRGWSAILHTSVWLLCWRLISVPCSLGFLCEDYVAMSFCKLTEVCTWHG